MVTLTRAEHEVLGELVRIDVDNGCEAIAERRRTSVHTVRAQVQMLLKKTRMHNRTQLAVWYIMVGRYLP